MCVFILYSLISPWTQQTSQFTPLVLEHSFLQFYKLWGQFSICALCCSYCQLLQFSFLILPATHHCWMDRGGTVWEVFPATSTHSQQHDLNTGHVMKRQIFFGHHLHGLVQFPGMSAGADFIVRWNDSILRGASHYCSMWCCHANLVASESLTDSPGDYAYKHPLFTMHAWGWGNTCDMVYSI